MQESLARTMGQAAARANASVYTVHVDTTTSGVGPASQKGLASSNVARDRALAGNWLNDFSNAAGGRLIYVPTGSAGFAFDRVLRETSAYYLLGVEPAPRTVTAGPESFASRCIAGASACAAGSGSSFRRRAEGTADMDGDGKQECDSGAQRRCTSS